MTTQETNQITAQLASLSTEVKTLSRDVGMMRDSNTKQTAELAKVNTNLEAISARMGAVVEQNGNDIKRLFHLHAKHNDKLSDHVTDHIPEKELREQFQRTDERFLRNAQRADDRFQKTEAEIARVNGRVNGWAGFFVAILVVIEVGKFVQGFFK